MAVREEGRPTSPVRQFIKPEVSWKADSYDKLIQGLGIDDLTEPPVTMDLSSEEIEAIVRDPTKLTLQLPNHTTSVERRIKDVTAVSEAGYCIGVHPRMGNRFEQEMSNKLFSRAVMPSFRSKQAGIFWTICHLNLIETLKNFHTKIDGHLMQ